MAPPEGSEVRRKRSRSRSPQRRNVPAHEAPAPKRRRSRSRSRSPPRQRKRPGAGSRTSAADRARVQERQAAREAADAAAAAQAVAARGSQDVVKQHYNAVPQRGREWRRTDSKIRNLRAYNNWAKSVLIQRFGPGEDFREGDMSRHAGDLAVLDMGCGKGGDLGKWHKAPQRVGVYVGIDPAEVSIEQARERHAELRRRARGRIFDASFIARDAYGPWIGDLPAVRDVGIDPNPPGGGRWGQGGFDVVTMMFCMHYSFESEAKANGMLRNASAVLKKGGRLIGVVPDSDVIRERVCAYYEKRPKQPEQKPQASDENAAAEEKRPDGAVEASSSTAAPNGSAAHEPPAPGTSDQLRTEAADTSASAGSDKANAEDSAKSAEDAGTEAPHWGNSVYSLAFPPTQVPPPSGVFRPPFGWRYQFFLTEAVESVPEYVVPFEALRAMAVDYGLELQYRRNFHELWREEGTDGELARLAQRMGVPPDMPSDPEKADEWEAIGLYAGFCFYKT